FSWCQKGIVVFQLQNTVVVFAAKVLQERDGVAVKMAPHLELRIKLHYESQWRRNVLINLRNHQAGSKLRQDCVEDPVVIAINIETKDAKVVFNLEIPK